MHQADDSDLFVEQVDWPQGTYQRGDAWLPLDRHDRDDPCEGRRGRRRRRRPHGARARSSKRSTTIPGFALARAFAPAGVLQGPRAFLEAPRARNGAELIAAWSHFAGPSVNVCWADIRGAIGVKVAGAIPRRLRG